MNVQLRSVTLTIWYWH